MESLGDTGQVGEHNEGVVERVALCVGTGEGWCSIGVNRSEHMVIGKDVIEAQILDRYSEFPHRDGIAPKLDLRVCDTDLHG
ncbi:MAG TPA: hypothetical protein VNU19_13720 [Candidatus Acidoferrum sp.]|nr:hypothetical protein [Candidatus Acidoferrum sp.]